MTRDLLPFGSLVIGVDPGTTCSGVALLSDQGVVLDSWSVRAPRGGDLLARLAFMAGAFGVIFGDVKRQKGERTKVTVVVEDGIYRTMPKVCAMLGEVRGLAMAAAWDVHFEVEKMSPVTWKAGMTKAERAMKKDRAYVTYWNRVLLTGCRGPDEIDAVLIARRFVRGAR